LAVHERGVDGETDITHCRELGDVHLAGLAVDGELETAAADLVERRHLREALGATHRAVAQHLASGAEPLLDDLAVAELLLLRADPAGALLDRLERYLERLRRELANSPACVAARLLDRAAGDRRRAARAGRPFVRHHARVAAHD